MHEEQGVFCKSVILWIKEKIVRQKKHYGAKTEADWASPEGLSPCDGEEGRQGALPKPGWAGGVAAVHVGEGRARSTQRGGTSELLLLVFEEQKQQQVQSDGGWARWTSATGQRWTWGSGERNLRRRGRRAPADPAGGVAQGSARALVLVSDEGKQATAGLVASVDLREEDGGGWAELKEAAHGVGLLRTREEGGGSHGLATSRTRAEVLVACGHGCCPMQQNDDRTGKNQ